MGVCKSEATEIKEQFVASDAAEDSDQPGEVAGSFTGDWSAIRGWRRIQGADPCQAYPVDDQREY